MEIKKRAAGRRVRHISMTENPEPPPLLSGNKKYKRGRPLAITRVAHVSPPKQDISEVTPPKRKRIEIFRKDSENESHQVAENIQRDLAPTMRQLEHMDAMEREEQEKREERIRQEHIEIQKEIEEERKRREREELNRVKVEQKRISEKKKRDGKYNYFWLKIVWFFRLKKNKKSVFSKFLQQNLIGFSSQIK